MEDLVIDKESWHVNAESSEHKERARTHFRARYLVLLTFLKESSLLQSTECIELLDSDNDFVFKRSDLTELGFELVKKCHSNWNVAYGQENSVRQLTQWKRNLARLRVKHNNSL